MAIAVGVQTYSLGSAPCIGAGLKWTSQELEAALAGPVAALVFDESGSSELETLLAGVAETDFELQGLASILAAPDDFENWRVGEAIAESYLVHHRACIFPWPDGRDERKRGSSLPGADLVGFQVDAKGDCFAFGEVKTSGEATYPPQAMYGRTGLKQQLEDLRDSDQIRTDLVRYLGHRAGSAPWRARFRAAAKRYIQSRSDVRVYGVLIRDVDPHENDLRARVARLANGCPADISIELLSLYLPAGSIEQLAKQVIAAKDKKGAAV